MVLTANRELDHYIDQQLHSFQVGAGMHVSKGTFVGLAPDGYAHPLAASDPFVGIAYEEADNSSGAAGAASARGEQGEAACGALFSNQRAWNLTFFRQHVTIAVRGSGVM